jgi:hypothetical protein
MQTPFAAPHPSEIQLATTVSAMIGAPRACSSAKRFSFKVQGRFFEKFVSTRPACSLWNKTSHSTRSEPCPAPAVDQDTVAKETKMGIEQAPTEKGKQAARGLRKSAAADERKVEAEKGSDLAKGADRFEERSKSSDGKSAGAKQRG